LDSLQKKIEILRDRGIITLFSVLIAIFLVIYYLGNILLPFFIALVFAFLLNDILLWLGKFKLRHEICVSIVILLFISIILLIIFGILPVLWKQLFAFISDWPRMFNNAVVWINETQTEYPEYFQHIKVEDVITILREQIPQAGQRVINIVFSNLPELVVIVVYVVLVPLIIFFLLNDWVLITTVMRDHKIVKGQLIGRIFDKMDSQIAGYIKGKFIEILIMFAVSYVTFLLFDLRYSLLLALLVGVSVVIPYVGAFLVTIPIIIVALFQFGISSEFYYLLASYIIIQILDGNVLVPLLFSETVDMHPVIIILSILLFGGLWGIVGVFFAIPLASLIRTIYSSINEQQQDLQYTK